MANVYRSSVVESDLAEIYDYIASDNPVAAEKLLRRIDERATLYAENPAIGTPHSELLTGLRSFVEGRYIAFYLTVPDGIRIVRVLHTARDLPRLFDADCS